MILLIVVALIYIRFSLNAPESLNPDLRSNIKVTHLLQAVMYVNVEGVSAQALALDCSYSAAQCDPLKKLLEDIFAVALQPHETYQFVLFAESEEILRTGTCEGGIVSRYPFVKGTTFFESTLVICSQAA